MKKQKVLLTIFLIVGAVLLGTGIAVGGFTDCVHKGAGICWECIGLG